LFPEVACAITPYHEKAREADAVIRPRSGSLKCVPSCDGGVNWTLADCSATWLSRAHHQAPALLSLLHGCGAGTHSPAPFSLCPKVNLGGDSEIRNIL